MSSVYGLNVPNDWEVVALDQIKSDEKKALISGPFGSNISAKYFKPTGVPVIRGNNLSLDVFTKFKENGFVFVSPEKADELGTWAQADDIIFTAVGTLGQIGLLSDNQDYPRYIISNKQIRLRLNQEKVTPQFVYYWLASDLMQEVIEQRNTGSSVPLINLGVVKNLLIPLPPLPEQKAIATVLSSLDDKIDLLHRQNKTLEAMAETLFRQWFIEEAKEDWEKGELCKLITIFSGYPFKSSSFTDNGKYKLITIKAVQDGYLELSNADEINELPDRLPNYCFLEKGDILLSLTGNVGRCCLVDRNLLLLNQRVAKLFPKSSRDLAFTYFMFRQGSMKAVLEEMAKGTAQANLSPIETAKLEILLPPEPLLEKFSKVATPLLNKILENKVSIRTLEKLRDTLLPKLMSGEVRVQYQTEQVA